MPRPVDLDALRRSAAVPEGAPQLYDANGQPVAFVTRRYLAALADEIETLRAAAAELTRLKAAV